MTRKKTMAMDFYKMDVLNNEILDQLECFSLMPMVVFNENKLLYANGFYLDAIEEKSLDMQFHNIYKDISDLYQYNRQEIRVKNKKGDVFYFDAMIKPVVYNKQPATFAMLIDISDRKKYEKNVAQIARLRALIIEISNSILDSVDLNDFYNFVLTTTLKAIDKSTLGTILILKDKQFNTVASYGYSEDIFDFHLPLKEAFIYKETDGRMDSVVNITDTSSLPYYIAVKTSFGEEVYIHSSLSAPIYFQGELYGIINIDSLEKNAFSEDDIKSIQFISKSIEIAITNRLLYEEKAYLSRYDRITGLYNRHFFDEHSEIMVNKAARYDEVFHLVMIDVDNLKQINDQFSHLVGDKLIRKVASTLKESMRESDIFARYGGDEFVGMLFNTTKEDVTTKLENLSKQLLDSSIIKNNEKIDVEISFGVSSFGVDGYSINDLIRIADDRMYLCKNKKKAQYK